MDKEILIENFVRKRENRRKTTFSLIIGMLIYCGVCSIFHHRLSVESKDIYQVSLCIFFVTIFILSQYTSTVLSTCPVCHLRIPTTRPRHASLREKPSRFGNGPLPDYCPHCGANFVQYKTFEFEQ